MSSKQNLRHILRLLKNKEEIIRPGHKRALDARYAIALHCGDW